MLFVAQTFYLACNQSPAGKLSVLAMGYCFFSLFAAFHTSSWSLQQQYKARAAGEEFPKLSLFSPHSDRTYFACAGQHEAPTCTTPGTGTGILPGTTHLQKRGFLFSHHLGFPCSFQLLCSLHATAHGAVGTRHWAAWKPTCWPQPHAQHADLPPTGVSVPQCPMPCSILLPGERGGELRKKKKRSWDFWCGQVFLI